MQWSPGEGQNGGFTQVLAVFHGDNAIFDLVQPEKPVNIWLARCSEKFQTTAVGDRMTGSSLLLSP